MTSLAHLDATPSTDWQRRGRCRSADAHLFFPPPEPESRAERKEREELAKAVCAGCAVRAECLAWALSVREPHGVWGGTSESERRMLLEARDARVR